MHRTHITFAKILYNYENLCIYYIAFQLLSLNWNQNYSFFQRQKKEFFFHDGEHVFSKLFAQLLNVSERKKKYREMAIRCGSTRELGWHIWKREQNQKSHDWHRKEMELKQFK